MSAVKIISVRLKENGKYDMVLESEGKTHLYVDCVLKAMDIDIPGSSELETTFEKMTWVEVSQDLTFKLKDT